MIKTSIFRFYLLHNAHYTFPSLRAPIRMRRRTVIGVSLHLPCPFCYRGGALHIDIPLQG